MKIYIETEMTELPKRQRRNEMNEQVKEIRKVVADSLYAHYVKTWDDPDPLDIPLIEEEADGAAEALWKAGYRKESEVAKEFFVSINQSRYGRGGIMTNGDKIRKAITDEWLAWYINYYFDADMQNNVILQQVPRNLMDCKKCRYNDAEKDDCKNGADCSPIILDWIKEVTE